MNSKRVYSARQNEVIKLGKNAVIQEFVVLGGLPRKEKKERSLVIGDNCLIRSGTVVYAGSVIGDNFQTGHGAVIREGNVIGDNVVVGVNSYLGPGNKIGNNVKIHTSCFLENVTLEEGVVVTPHVVFTDDPHPPCPRFKECSSGAVVRKGAVLGANSTILPNVEIGENALIGAGSVVTKDIPENSVAVGNPAKVIKKVDELKCPKGLFKYPYEWRKS